MDPRRKVARLVPAPAGVDVWMAQAAATALLAIAVTWPVHRRLAELLRRGGAHAVWPHIASDLAWGLPSIMLVQGVFFRFLTIRPDFAWTITPEPVVGPLRVLVLLPHVLIRERSAELMDLLWLVTAALSLLAVVVVVRAAWMLLSRKDVRG